jgi:hypothetical protein
MIYCSIATLYQLPSDVIRMILEYLTHREKGCLDIALCKKSARLNFLSSYTHLRMNVANISLHATFLPWIISRPVQVTTMAFWVMPKEEENLQKMLMKLSPSCFDKLLQLALCSCGGSTESVQHTLDFFLSSCIRLKKLKLSDMRTPLSIGSLSSFQNLEELDISNNRLFPLSSVIEAFREHSRIYSINACGCAVTNSDLMELHRLIHLTHLNLRQCNITDEGMVHLNQCLSLKNINLHGNHLTDACLAMLPNLSIESWLMSCDNMISGDMLSIFLSQHLLLQQFDLMECDLSREADTIIRDMMPPLVYLSLAYCRGVTSDSIHHFLKRSKHCLTHLNLLCCPNIDDTTLVEPLPLLQHLNLVGTSVEKLDFVTGMNRIKRLEVDSIESSELNDPSEAIRLFSLFGSVLNYLNVNDCYVTDEMMLIVSENCPNLEVAKLNNCYHVSDTSLIPLATKCRELHTLHLENTAVTGELLLTLAKYCEMINLNIKSCHLIRYGLFQFLMAMKNMKALVAVGITQPFKDANNKVDIANPVLIKTNLLPLIRSSSLLKLQYEYGFIQKDAFKYWKLLETLELRSCRCVDDAMLQVITNHCIYLQELIIPGCANVTSVGIQTLSACSLTQLVVSKCARITDDGMISALRNSPSLEYLDISYCILLTNQVIHTMETQNREVETIIAKGCPLIAPIIMDATIFPYLHTISQSDN